MLKFTFCPTFTVYSFIFFVTLLDIIIYIATLIATGADGESLGDEFLGPSTEVLDQFGAKNPFKMRYYK